MSGWQVGNAPADYPLTYPGATPPGDALLLGSHLYPLMPPYAGAAPGAWTVRPGHRPLDDVLADEGAVPVAGRAAVLAVGSNACAAQMRRKLSGPDMRDRLGAVPMMRVRAAGIATGHSAHVGRWGYVPRTPVARPGYHAHWVIWLDPEQAAIIDATEVNYDVAAGTEPLVMAADLSVRIPGWVYYRSKWGALAWTASTTPAPAVSQGEMFGCLLRQPWFADLMPAGTDTAAKAVRVLAADEAVRVRVREAMAVNAAVPDGLQDLR